MPKITLNKKVLENLIGKKLPLDELKNRISYLGTDLESIEGNDITVEIFPNRPDMLSEQGFARALAAFIGAKPGLRSYPVKKSEHRVIIESSVKKVRPYTACALVKNLHATDEKIREVINIQEKLHITYGRNRKKAAIGIYPFDKIKTPIYYKALPKEKIIFKPLGSLKKMNAVQILREHPVGREYGYLLEGLDTYPIFIDSENRILSMPPIINSHDTGKITTLTKDVFIECSGFDLDTLTVLLNIIVSALADMGGDIYSMNLYYGAKKIVTPDLKPKKMKLDKNYVNKLLGLQLRESDIKKWLRRMGFDYVNKNVLIPAYRADILHPIDLIEDVAIAYGYEHFNPEIAAVSTIAREASFESIKRKIQEALIGFGLIETCSFSIMNKELIKKMKLTVNCLALKNPLSKEFDVLRPSLLPSLLHILSENQHHEYPQRLFEINTVIDEYEKVHLGIVFSHEKAYFTELKQILDALCGALGLSYSLVPQELPSFIEGRAGDIFVNKRFIGVIGEIHPEVLVNFNLGNPVVALELNLDSLYL